MSLSPCQGGKDALTKRKRHEGRFGSGRREGTASGQLRASAWPVVGPICESASPVVGPVCGSAWLAGDGLGFTGPLQRWWVRFASPLETGGGSGLAVSA